MTDAAIDMVFYAVRVLFLILAPLTLGVVVAGMAGAALQSVTGIKEPALGYAFRVLFLVTALYFFAPMAIELVVSLTQMVYGS
ncbi:MAG: flagellar biosynthetic protein FliQ [Bdellovibrionales bacterium]|nr:flagellar biosynthetic protein FliQ [Bdellovibrionales bacterium]